jgi:integrase
MNGFISKLGPAISSLLDYREALGHSPKTHARTFYGIDRFFAVNYPDADTLTSNAVIEWLNDQCYGLDEKATALRILGKYLSAIGKESYVLPRNFIGCKNAMPSKPYLFSDNELSLLFSAADSFPSQCGQPFLPEIVPVMFRLIYTCGLRPNEGRELKREKVDMKTGEIQIVNTKRKKERLVVMSTDMLGLAKRYDEKRAIFAHGNEYFFPSWTGGAFSNLQISSYFRACWKRSNPSVDTLPKVRVYSLRHRFASTVMARWIDEGQPIMAKLPYLRSYMGHNHISETLYYVHLLPENLVKAAGIDWDTFDGILPNPLDDDEEVCI